MVAAAYGLGIWLSGEEEDVVFEVNVNSKGGGLVEVALSIFRGDGRNGGEKVERELDSENNVVVVSIERDA